MCLCIWSGCLTSSMRHENSMLSPDQRLTMVRFFAALLIAIAWTASALAATPSEEPASGAPPSEQVSVAYCVDCVPFHFSDEHGQPAGMIIDMWRLWSEKTGVALDFKPAQWSETLKMVAAGEADVHAGLFFNRHRPARPAHRRRAGTRTVARPCPNPGEWSSALPASAALPHSSC